MGAASVNKGLSTMPEHVNDSFSLDGVYGSPPHILAITVLRFTLEDGCRWFISKHKTFFSLYVMIVSISYVYRYFSGFKWKRDGRNLRKCDNKLFVGMIFLLCNVISSFSCERVTHGMCRVECCVLETIIVQFQKAINNVSLWCLIKLSPGVFIFIDFSIHTAAMLTSYKFIVLALKLQAEGRKNVNRKRWEQQKTIVMNVEESQINFQVKKLSFFAP